MMRSRVRGEPSGTGRAGIPATVLRGFPAVRGDGCKNPGTRRSRDMSAVPHPPASRFGDPRYYQIAVLAGLLTYGTVVLEFDVRPWQIPLTLAVAC